MHSLKAFVYAIASSFLQTCGSGAGKIASLERKKTQREHEVEQLKQSEPRHHELVAFLCVTRTELCTIFTQCRGPRAYATLSFADWLNTV